MNFEEIESLWAGQIPASPQPSPLLLDRQRSLLREFKRRSRFLGYGAFGVAFGLVFTPLLSVVNYLYLPRVGTPLYWLNAGLHLLVLVVTAVLVARRMQRHRALGRARIATLREQTELTFACLEMERRDYRWLPWTLGVWCLLAILSIAANTPFHGGSFQAVALRVGLVLGFTSAIGTIFWRHYRVHLLPAHARQQELLRQMERGA